jgi:predicted CXXCH cytochrome family protein
MMKKISFINNQQKKHWVTRPWLVFAVVFASCVGIGAAISLVNPAAAANNTAPVSAPPVALALQATPYAGSDACAKCHQNIHDEWLTTRHAQAFSSPIFQRDWASLSSAVSCLECHTTGYNPKTGEYAQAGVSCEACHGPYQSGHPASPMPITPNADLCSKCHKSTTDEWRSSKHGQADPPVQCQACHDPHSQNPLAPTITDLCSNCHKDRGSSFTHGTHASAGLECSNCHMYTAPRTGDPIGGLVATGHTFTVGSDACIGCHQDTVHTRNTIVQLSGEVKAVNPANVEELTQKVQDQEKTITSLKSKSTVRLYTGLAQGAIIGLITGGAAAWVVSKRIQVVEVEE